ncbi:MAG: alpha-2-macroglobulin family protein [Actinomycetota bacterium]|nr:alpha-2-macroglobulin family protein [Actinomycetota bacterium]
MEQRRIRRYTALLVAVGLVMAACDDGGDSSSSSTATVNASYSEGAPRVFGLHLSEGTALAGTDNSTHVVQGDELPAQQLQAILARLPEFLGGEALQEPFNWPTQTTPPPRAGITVDGIFPPEQLITPDTVPTGPLHVLRHQPDGDVPIAPYLSITFDQPMVPVTTVGQLDALDVPATLTPAVEGRWQWIGTRTLRFDAANASVDRLAMATTFTVEVPKGTKSASGGTLAETVSFTFTTPPATVQSFGPQSDTLSLTQVFVAVFDQRIDTAAVLNTVHLRADGKEVDVRLATAEEIDADDNTRMQSEGAEEGRWLAFRPVDPLPADAALSIAIGPDTPSAEGPATTTEAQTFSGRTYAPLRIQSASCAYGDECPPGTQLYVQFNNVLDAALSDASKVTISPALAGMQVSLQYNSLVISGNTLARTTYEITVPQSFTDTYGQQLSGDRTVKVRIGSAAPSIQQFDAITTLDPFATTQQLSVLTVNHDKLRVRVFAADPTTFAQYYRYAYDRDWAETKLPDWNVLADDTLAIEGDKDTPILTAVDLAGVLQGRRGQVIVLVEPVPAVSPNSNDYWQNRPALTWVQSTTLGLDAVADASDMYVWTTDLTTGAPRKGVQLSVIAGNTVDPGTTDGEGQATLSLPASSNDEGLVAVVATDGDETAILPVGATRELPSDEARWYVFDDRQVYQPGETMQVKGWVRRLTLSDDARVTALRNGATIDYTVTDSYGNEVLKGSTDVKGLGGFDLTLELPETADLGMAYVQLSLRGESGLSSAEYSHQFQIEEYRRPEFEVTARPESEGPYVSTSPATVAAVGSYYAGGPLVGAQVDWLVTTSAANYSPPGWSDYTFGIWTPWWYMNDARGMVDESYPSGDYTGDSQVAEYHGTTDGAGTHYLQLGFEGTDGALPDLPVTVSAQATVTDVNRQAWSDTTSLLVHPADRYVGLRSTRTFVRQGDPLEIEVVVTGIDGEVQPGVQLNVVAGRVEWKYVDNTWTEVSVDEQTCAVTSATEATTCTFDTEVGGQYKVTAVVAGSQRGFNRSELTTWVSGAEAQPTRTVDQQELTVVPDKATYAPGDTAELLVQAPFATGEGMLLIARNGVRSTLRFTLTDGSAIVQVPITDDDIPGLTLGLEVVGTATRTGDDGKALPDAPQRPAYAVGSMTLSVPPVSRTLTVDATPRATELTPGDSTAIDVKVTDANGAPVKGAEFAVVVVDEAVLALSGYQLDDPLSVFYSSGWEYLRAAYGRSQITLVDPTTLVPGDNGGVKDDETTGGADGDTTATTVGVAEEMPSAAPEASRDAMYSANDGSPVDVRSNFAALALFAPTVTTGADGTASVDVTLPDNLTRYRVMVVAVSGADRFGSDEANITARLPLAVRPSAPRFANYGDAFELPVVLQNQTDAPLTVDVVLETANLAPGEPVGTTVTVPANDRVEVRFPVSTQQAGTAAFRVTAVSGDLADSATVQLPVYTPATAEAFATYGTVDNGAVDQPLLAPTGVIPQFGGLEVTTSSTSLQALTDAVLYIVDYKYESSDGRASRIMAIAALREVLDAFDAEGLPSAAELEASVASDIAALAAMQNDDGGFSWWRRGDMSEPFDTVQVAHALVVAKAEGYTVPRDMFDRVMAHIADIESYIPSAYGESARDTIRAYALWVRALAGQGDTAKADAFYGERHDDLAVDALAWLWTAVGDDSIKAEIARTIANRAVETAGAANFTTGYDDSSYLVMQSDRRTDGIVLDALIANDPTSDLIPKVVTGLLANQVRGRWDSIQENSFILLALKRYFDVYEAQTPNFVARVWLGERFAGEHTFAGRETDRARVSIPMTDVVAAGDTDLVLSKTGTGRMYYRIGLRYAPSDLTLDALDRGFTVSRTYEAVDDPSDVSQDANGTWHIKAGARVRVKLTMVAESQRTHVALIDPLPAGLESLNPALAITQTVPAGSSSGDGGDGGYYPMEDMYWWWGTWYQHEQLRSDRTEAFTTLLPAGVYSYEYIARATTPGTFVVPPTRAEEMYAPETFGRSATDKVVID